MSNAHTISMQLLAYAKKYNINHQMILIRFFHERLLYRISISEYHKNLILKGGNLLYIVQGKTARPTVDIDLSGSNISNDTKKIKTIFRQILSVTAKDAVLFDCETIKAVEISESNQYAGVRLKVMAKLANIKQLIQIDIGFGDVITPAPIPLHYPILLEALDVPMINAYTLETVIAEKLQAIIVLAELNSRMKDFYDIYFLLNTNEINKGILKEAILQTFSNRNTKLNFESIVFKEEFYADINRSKMWKAYLRKINSEEIPFEKVILKIKLTIQEIFK